MCYGQHGKEGDLSLFIKPSILVATKKILFGNKDMPTYFTNIIRNRIKHNVYIIILPIDKY